MKVAVLALIVAIALYTPRRLFRRSVDRAYTQGVTDGVAEGYMVACGRIFDAVQGTSDLAHLSESMGTPMDSWTYTTMLAERLSVSLHADVVLVVGCDEE